MKTHIVLPAAHHHHFCFGAWKESLNEVLLETCVCLACLKQAISVLKHVSACGLGAPTGPSFSQGVADAGGGGEMTMTLLWDRALNGPHL